MAHDLVLEPALHSTLVLFFLFSPLFLRIYSNTLGKQWVWVFKKFILSCVFVAGKKSVYQSAGTGFAI